MRKKSAFTKLALSWLALGLWIYFSYDHEAGVSSISIAVVLILIKFSIRELLQELRQIKSEEKFKADMREKYDLSDD